MSKKKILVVFGTRPEAIKMAPVIKELQRHPQAFKCLVCVTAQHRQMLDQVLHLFAIRPDYDLNLMAPNQGLYDLTCNVLQGLKPVLERERPDLVLVHGDTTTAMAASLAAFYQKTPVGHVEAGLRTGNPYAPWPEEMNRRMAGAIASLHFAPTARAKENLEREGVPAELIHVTGNTVVDALFMVQGKIRELNLDQEIIDSLSRQIPEFARIVSESRSRILLVTGHRRENFGEGLRNICQALKILAERSDVEIIYPVHRNPNVLGAIRVFLSGHPRIHLIDPLDYLSFVHLMDRSYLILTDSGGIQEEAPSLGKPVLLIRQETERQEAISTGSVRLVGVDAEKIVDTVVTLLENSQQYDQMRRAGNPFGDGRAAERIVSALKAV